MLIDIDNYDVLLKYKELILSYNHYDGLIFQDAFAPYCLQIWIKDNSFVYDYQLIEYPDVKKDYSISNDINILESYKSSIEYVPIADILPYLSQI